MDETEIKPIMEIPFVMAPSRMNHWVPDGTRNPYFSPYVYLCDQMLREVFQLGDVQEFTVKLYLQRPNPNAIELVWPHERAQMVRIDETWVFVKLGTRIPFSTDTEDWLIEAVFKPNCVNSIFATLEW